MKYSYEVSKQRARTPHAMMGVVLGSLLLWVGVAGCRNIDNESLAVSEEPPVTLRAVSGLSPALYQNVMPSTEDVRWTQVGVGHGGGTAFVRIDPANPDRVIESMDMGGTYMTTDGGESYFSVRNTDVSFPTFEYLSALEWAESDPDVVYGGTHSSGWSRYNGLFKSTDGGVSWESVGEDVFLFELESLIHGEPVKKRYGIPISAIGIDPDDADVVYVGTGNFYSDWGFRSYGGPAGGGRPNRAVEGIYASRDGGASWERRDAGIPEEAMLRSMIVTKEDSPVGKMLFAATSHGFFVSSDEGKSWEKRPAQARPFVTAVDNDYVAEKTLPHDGLMGMDVAYDGEGRPILFAVLRTQVRRTGDGWGFAGGLFRSDDLGETWTDINGNLRFPMTHALKGRTRPYLASHLAYQEIMSDPAQRKAMVFDSKEDIAKMGTSFAARNVFNAAMDEKRTAIHKADETTRRLENTPGTLGQFLSVRVNPNDPDTVYMVNQPPTGRFYHALYPLGVWKTTDGGETWTCITRKGYGWGHPHWRSYKPAGKAQINMPDDRYAMRGDPKRPFPTGIGFTNFILFDLCRADPDVLICYGLQKMYRSEDGGLSWKESANIHFEDGRFIGKGNSNLCVNDLDLSPASDDIFFACQDKGVILSRDNGATLKQLLRSRDFVRSPIAVAYDPAVPGKCFFLEPESVDGARALAFYKTLDGGESFEHVKLARIPYRETHTYTKAIPGVMHSSGASEILVDPLSPEAQRTLLVGNAFIRFDQFCGHGRLKEGGTLFISRDEGENWEPFSEGLDGSSQQVTSLAAAFDGTILLGMRQHLDSNDGAIRAGGVWKLNREAQRWEKFETLPLRDVRDVTFDPNDPDVIYAAGGFGSQSEVYNDVNPKWVANGGLYRSADGGLTWTRLIEAPIVSLVAVAPWNSNVLYCALPDDRNGSFPIVSPGIYRSTDRGATWQRASTGIATPRRITELKFNPRRPGEVWVTTYASGAYKAVDPDANDE